MENAVKNNKDTEIENIVNRSKRELYIKIFLSVFVIIVITLFLYFIFKKDNNSLGDSSFNRNFIEIPDPDFRITNPLDNNMSTTTYLYPEGEDGLWSYYNILANKNIIFADKFKNGVVYIERNYLGKTKTITNKKYTLHVLTHSLEKYNYYYNTSILFEERIDNVSINNNLSHIIISGENKSVLFSIEKIVNQNKEPEYFLNILGEVVGIKKSAIDEEFLYYTKNNFLYKMSLKDLKEIKITNVPIQNYEIFIQNNDLYLKNKTYNKNVQTILKLNKSENVWDLYSSSYEEEIVLPDAKLIKKDNYPILEYNYNQSINTKINTTLEKCSAGEGYLFCANSTEYKDLTSWLNKENFISDKIDIYSLENRDFKIINTKSHIYKDFDIDKIFIKNNFLYFKERNTGAFIELDLKILNDKRF